MTEKRISDIWCNEMGHIGFTYDGVDLRFEDGSLETFLNELVEENEQLKQEKQELFDFFMNEYDRQEDESIDREIKLEEHIKSLIDINEQLKQKNKELEEIRRKLDEDDFDG